ncbi:MAG: cobalamin-dependent protein [Eubacteriaceae bacterium]|jgi:methylmalonyl-CoA mutase cobalamin-binding domain/chain
MSKIAEVKELVSKGKSKQIAGAVQQALDDGDSAQDILNGMIDTMGEVGDRFSRDEIFVPEMLVAAKAMKKGLDVLEPHLAEGADESLGGCIIGTVQGDLHDIGKNLVAMMIKSAGFDVDDLGVDVDPKTFIAEVQKNPDVKLVALSGLLTTTMPSMQETVKELKSCGIGNFKVMVGGAPVTPDFADQIGADGYAPDAGAAVNLAKSLAAQV